MLDKISGHCSPVKLTQKINSTRWVRIVYRREDRQREGRRTAQGLNSQTLNSCHLAAELTLLTMTVSGHYHKHSSIN